MSEMLEKVARAMQQADFEMGRAAERGEETGDEYAVLAVAAVMALREPDEKMLKVGQDSYLYGVNYIGGEYEADPEAAYQLFTAMIDSILSTPTTRGEVK